MNMGGDGSGAGISCQPILPYYGTTSADQPKRQPENNQLPIEKLSITPKSDQIQRVVGKDGLRGETWVDHELNRIWENICWGCPERIPRAEPIYRWLLDNQPRDEEIVLNHGDANYTNFMFRDNNLIAALDWEFACLGPKEFDLAFVLVVTGVLTIGQTAPPGFPTPEEIKAEYQRISGYQLRYWEYYCKNAYFSVAQRLWMGIRLFPPEKRTELDVRPNYCIDRILGREPIEI